MWFAAPEILVLLVGLPVIGMLYWRRWRHVRHVRQPFDGARRAGNPSGPAQLLAALVCLLVGCASLILAAAEPRIVREGRRDIYRKIDLVFLFDTSYSMRARDVAPSRIERASQEVQNFLRYNRDYIGRVGLVSFASSSIALSYLTSDPANIDFFLEYLASDAQPGAGTDVGAGLTAALALLEKEKSIDPAWQPGKVIFVLVSDGDDQGGVLRDAVSRVVQMNIRIYSLGVGTELGDYIPIGEEEGRTLFLKDEAGKQIMTTLEEGTMRWVAESTGGAYFRSRSGDDLRKNLGQILERERVVVDVDTSAREVPLHAWFLAVGFGALALRLMW